jgi:hypothetical protein
MRNNLELGLDLERDKEITHEISILDLEHEMLEDLRTSKSITNQHYLSEYFRKQYDEKVQRWERITGRKYSLEEKRT